MTSNHAETYTPARVATWKATVNSGKPGKLDTARKGELCPP